MRQAVDAPLRFDHRAAFYAWADAQPHGKWEREDGLVVKRDGSPAAIGSERMDHGRIKGNAFRALSAAIEAAGLPCEAFADGPAMAITPSTDFIPDAVVDCGERGQGTAQSVANPVIVLEVLSPSTACRDTGVKLRGYFGVPSVQHYLVVWSDQQLVVQHSRSDDDRLSTRIPNGMALIGLHPPGLTLVVADLYRGTDVTAAEA